MAHGKDAARDLVHGRRGGHWLPDDYVPTPAPANAPRCSVCGRHWSCAPPCEGCHRLVGPKGENCHCTAEAKKARR